MSQDTEIVTELDQGVMTIGLHRPGALNALTHTMRNQLLETLAQARNAKEIRCLILTGAGRAFSVGQDVREMQEMYRDHPPDLGRLVRDEYNPIVDALLNMPKPVVGLIHGPAAGGGLSLALACDIRVITDQTSFIPAFVKVGLAPDTGASFLLARALGWSRALALSLLGQSITAEDAMNWGLAHFRFATLEQAEIETRNIANNLAEGPTQAMLEIRQLMLQSQGLSWPDVLRLEATVQDRLGQTQDHQEAVAAFLERRTAKFLGQ